MAAVPGGFAMGDGETRAGAISYAVQMYALKGEDKFVAVPDVFSFFRLGCEQNAC